MTPLHYEDMHEGRRWRSAARTITEADVVAFAGVSSDFNPIHVDAEHAATTAFGERIAHGALVPAVATGPTKDPEAGLVTQAVEVRNQRDEVVASGEFATRVARREAVAA